MLEENDMSQENGQDNNLRKNLGFLQMSQENGQVTQWSDSDTRTHNPASGGYLGTQMRVN